MGAGFWNGRRVFLTGHTGFKGGWLSLWLQSLGAQVFGYSLPAPTTPSFFERSQVAEGMVSGLGDVRDLQSLGVSLRQAAPEIVFHLAAQPLVRESYASPVETYSTNVMGTVHLLEAVRAVESVRAVLIVTTDKCYENREWDWGYREQDRLGGRDPYSASKACAELVTAAYRASFLSRRAGGAPVAVATARAGNVVGGGDWAKDRLVPDLLASFASGSPAVLRHPLAIRPWQHVLDALSGYLCLGQKLVEQGQQHATAWNFGPRDEDTRTVAWIADRLAELWGEGARWSCPPGEQPHESHTLRLDISKASAKLGWSPGWTAAEALARTVEWHRGHLSSRPMRGLSLEQIALHPFKP